MTSVFSIIPPFLAVGELVVKRSSDISNYFKSMPRYFCTGVRFLLTGRPNPSEQDLLETRRASWSPPPPQWRGGKSNTKLCIKVQTSTSRRCVVLRFGTSSHLDFGMFVPVLSELRMTNSTFGRGRGVKAQPPYTTWKPFSLIRSSLYPL